MHASKPHLLQIGAIARVPERGLEILPLLVQREGVAGDANVAADLAIVEQVLVLDQTEEREGQAQGTDGIPYPDKPDGRALV